MVAFPENTNNIWSNYIVSHHRIVGFDIESHINIILLIQYKVQFTNYI